MAAQRVRMLVPLNILLVRALVGMNPPPVHGFLQGATPLLRASIIELATVSTAGLIFSAVSITLSSNSLSMPLSSGRLIPKTSSDPEDSLNNRVGTTDLLSSICS